MDNFVTIEDIIQFLNSKGFAWNGKKYEGGWSDEDENYSDITIRAFSRELYGLPVVMSENNRKPMSFELNVRLATFLIYKEDYQYEWDARGTKLCDYKDFSEDWTKFLLNKYGSNYAKLLQEETTERISYWENRTKKEVKPLEDKIDNIKKENKVHIDYWKNLKNLADEYIGNNQNAKS